MSQSNVDEITKYLREAFPEAKIGSPVYTQANDLEFVVRDGIGTHNFKASMEFLMNVPAAEVRSQFEELNIKQVMLDSKNLGTFVKQYEVDTYETK